MIGRSQKHRTPAEALAAYQRQREYAAHVDSLFADYMAYCYQRPDWRTFLSLEQIEHDRWLFRQDRNEWIRTHRHRARVFSYGPKPPGCEELPLLRSAAPADPPTTPLTDDLPPPESSK